MKCVILQWHIVWWCIGNLVYNIRAAKWVFYSLRKYIFIYVIDWYIYIYIYIYELISFDYVWTISMMFKKWYMSEKYWVDLKCLSVLRLWFKLCKLFGNMSCWNCLCFMKKLSFEWFQSIWWNVRSV
jgi:hypothetical protein